MAAQPTKRISRAVDEVEEEVVEPFRRKYEKKRKDASASKSPDDV